MPMLLGRTGYSLAMMAEPFATAEFLSSCYCSNKDYFSSFSTCEWFINMLYSGTVASWTGIEMFMISCCVGSAFDSSTFS